MQQVKTDSQNAVKMGPGTLYGSLDRMIAAGLVAKSDTRDPRRIYYKLTALAQATLRARSLCSRICPSSEMEWSSRRPRPNNLWDSYRCDAGTRSGPLAGVNRLEVQIRRLSAWCEATFFHAIHK